MKRTKCELSQAPWLHSVIIYIEFAGLMVICPVTVCLSMEATLLYMISMSPSMPSSEPSMEAVRIRWDPNQYFEES